VNGFSNRPWTATFDVAVRRISEHSGGVANWSSPRQCELIEDLKSVGKNILVGLNEREVGVN
jgi:hypothetical protein